MVNIPLSLFNRTHEDVHGFFEYGNRGYAEWQHLVAWWIRSLPNGPGILRWQWRLFLVWLTGSGVTYFLNPHPAHGTNQSYRNANLSFVGIELVHRSCVWIIIHPSLPNQSHGTLNPRGPRIIHSWRVEQLRRSWDVDNQSYHPDALAFTAISSLLYTLTLLLEMSERRLFSDQ